MRLSFPLSKFNMPNQFVNREFQGSGRDRSDRVVGHAVRKQKKPPRNAQQLRKMGWMSGLEPPASGATTQCSNLLSYIHHNRTIQQPQKHRSIITPPAKQQAKLSRSPRPAPAGRLYASSPPSPRRPGAGGSCRKCRSRCGNGISIPASRNRWSIARWTSLVTGYHWSMSLT